jgi:hypothetical protein
MDVARRAPTARPSALATLHRCARRPCNATIWQHVAEPACWALEALSALDPDEAKKLELAQE